jgi:hypothetical protein
LKKSRSTKTLFARRVSELLEEEFSKKVLLSENENRMSKKLLTGQYANLSSGKKLLTAISPDDAKYNRYGSCGAQNPRSNSATRSSKSSYVVEYEGSITLEESSATDIQQLFADLKSQLKINSEIIVNYYSKEIGNYLILDSMDGFHDGVKLKVEIKQKPVSDKGRLDNKLLRSSSVKSEVEMIPGSDIEILEKIGEGNFGKVFKGIFFSFLN